MLPTMLRALPWIVTSCLVLACESEQPATPADATRKPGADAKTGTDAKPGADTKTTPDTKPTPKPPKPTLEPPKPVPPRTVVFFREAPKYRVKLWVLPEPTAPEPTAARELPMLADDGGGDVYHGSASPVLSGDGQWLAYLDQGRLQLARVDGTVNHRITKHKGDRVMVLISGFSPDSSRLMFYQGEVQTEEGAALPKGVVPGSYELTVADRKLEPQTSLEAFGAYTTDGRHVIFQRSLPDRSTALVRFDLDTGAAEELQRLADPYGYGQLVLHRERIVFLHHPAEGKSMISSDDLRGGARMDLSPEASFAQIQWPQVSPDGLLVSYTDETSLKVRTFDPDDTPRTLTTCSTRHCDHGWDSGGTVIVLDGTKLSRVSLDGTAKELATDVKAFVLAGAPG